MKEIAISHLSASETSSKKLVLAENNLLEFKGCKIVDYLFLLHRYFFLMDKASTLITETLLKMLEIISM